MKLYEISAEFTELWEQIQAVQNDESIVDGVREQKLSELEEKFRVMLQESTDKVENAAKVVRMLEADEDAAAAEAKRLSERAVSIGKNAKRLKDLILFAVDGAFNGKVKTPLFSIWGQTSAQTVSFEPAPDADLKKIAEVYPQFVRITTDLDRRALASAYKDGAQIPAAITATPNPGTRYLRIK